MREHSASVGTSTVRSHAPYCEAKGPIVDEGFVSARIRDLQKAYDQTCVPPQSHSPMSPCPIYPKLQKYELFSRAEPNGPTAGPLDTRPLESQGFSPRRLLRNNHVSARYLTNSGSLGAWSRSTEDLGPTKVLWPPYRKLVRKDFSASTDNLRGSSVQEVLDPTPRSTAGSFATPNTAGGRWEHESPTKPRLLLRSNQDSTADWIQASNPGVGKEWSNATMSDDAKKNDLQKGLGLTYHDSATPSQRERVSDTQQDQLADSGPIQASGAASIQSLVEGVVIPRPNEPPVHHHAQKNHSRLTRKYRGLSSPSAARVAGQNLDEDLAWLSSPKDQQTEGPPRMARSKGGYGDLTNAQAQQTNSPDTRPDDDNGPLPAEAPSSISLNPQKTSKRAKRGLLRQQSLPTKLAGRHSSKASTPSPTPTPTTTSSAQSSTRSSSLWKKWRSWKLVLADKAPSSERSSSDRSKRSSLSSANEVLHHRPHEAIPANRDRRSASASHDLEPPSLETRLANNLSQAHPAGGTDESDARKLVAELPATQMTQPPDILPEGIEESGPSRGKKHVNTTPKSPDTIPTSGKNQAQPPSKLVASFALDDSLLNSNATISLSPFRDDDEEDADRKDHDVDDSDDHHLHHGGEATAFVKKEEQDDDDNGKADGSVSGGGGGGGAKQRIKNIQILIRLDKMADLVIQAHVQGKGKGKGKSKGKDKGKG